MKSYLAKAALQKNNLGGVYKEEDYDINTFMRTSELPTLVKNGVELLRNNKIFLPEGQLLIVKSFVGNGAPNDIVTKVRSGHKDSKINSSLFPG